MRAGETRAAVLARDISCRAFAIDPTSGPCRDTWGTVTEDYTPEMDYVRLRAIGRRHELPEDHVLLCPGHHRGTGSSGGRVWATANRAKMADYLGPFRESSR